MCLELTSRTGSLGTSHTVDERYPHRPIQPNHLRLRVPTLAGQQEIPGGKRHLEACAQKRYSALENSPYILTAPPVPVI